MKQEVTRRHTSWVLDSVSVLAEPTKLDKEEVRESPEDGVYLYGLKLEGAAWDRRNMRLQDPPLGVIYTQLPVVLVAAAESDKRNVEGQVYHCPVYQSAERTDAGHIFTVDLRSEEHPHKWVQRGVAALSAILD